MNTLTLEEVMDKTDMSRHTIRAYRSTKGFPAPVWIEEEVVEWILRYEKQLGACSVCGSRNRGKNKHWRACKSCYNAVAVLHRFRNLPKEKQLRRIEQYNARTKLTCGKDREHLVMVVAAMTYAMTEEGKEMQLSSIIRHVKRKK